MPSSSFRQARMMARAAADPAYAEERHISPDAAREFHEADKTDGRFVNPDGSLKEEPQD